VAYNLHIFANHLMAAERKKADAKTNGKQRPLKQAA